MTILETPDGPGSALVPAAALRGASPSARLWRQALAPILRSFEVGRLTVAFPDGARLTVVGARPGPDALVQINHYRALMKALLGGYLGFAESYLAGNWESPDLLSLLDLGAANDVQLTGRLRAIGPLRALSRLFHRSRPNSKRGSRRNIAFHYDLGNAFYRTWLDPELTYSSGLYNAPAMTLAEAQDAKYAALLNRLDLRPDMHVLEIGCGWGGLAIRLARGRDCRVTAITLSREQYTEASRRVQALGLADKVEVRLQDYRDITGTYDRIASLEMFEAVGEENWPVFFRALRRRLVPGGVAALQVITIADEHFADYRRETDFIQRYIFPGGMLPSPTAFREGCGAAGFKISNTLTFGSSYAETLLVWHQAFLRAWPAIAVQGFDQRFKRMWEFYLLYCAAGFRAGIIDVAQYKLTKA